MDKFCKLRDPAALTRAVDRGGRQRSPRATLPVLTMFWLANADERLVVGSTDLEAGVLYTASDVPVSGMPERGICAPSALLELLRTWEGELTLSWSEKTTILELKGVGQTAALKCITGMEYPPFPGAVSLGAPDDPVAITANGGDFRAAVESIAFAASEDKARPVLSGVLLELTGSKLTLAATDGSRLAQTSIEVDGPDTPKNVILGAAHLAQFCKMIDGDGPVTIDLSQAGRARLQYGPVEYFIQAIEGTFPDYRQIIPAKQTIEVDLPRAGLISAIRRARIFSGDGSKICRLTLDQGEHSYAVISGYGDELGESREEFEIKNPGEKLEIGFNVGFMAEILAASPEDEFITIGLTLDTSPMTITGKATGGWLSVLMPMHLGQ